MKLLFQSSDGNERVIAEVGSFAEANEEMDKFMDDRNFKSYYKRVWDDGDRLKVDVGSWSEFFFVEGCSFNDVCKEQEGLNEEN